MSLRTATVLLLLVASALPFFPSAAASPVGFYETEVVLDTPTDFAGNGGLDITGIYASERYDPDYGNGTGSDIVQFRIELRNRAELTQFGEQTKFDFVLGYTVGGQAKQVHVIASQACPIQAPPSGLGPKCGDPIIERPHFSTPNGIYAILPASELPAGTAVTGVWAASSTVTPASTTWQDVAPKDSMNTPQGAELEPPASTASYTTQGPFPYLTLGEMSPTTRPIKPGASTEFLVEFVTHASLEGNDRILVRFANPPDWKVETNLGQDILTGESTRSYQYTVTVTAPVTAAANQTVKIPMDAVLVSVGGHVTVDFFVETTKAAHFPYPEFRFNLTKPPSLKSGEEAAFQVQITRDGNPLVRYKVNADFIQGGTVVATVPMAYQEKSATPGVYEARYKFPKGGQWSVEVYVAELEPSPYQAFQVEVSKAEGGLPGAGAGMALVGLAAVALVRRRTPRNP